MTEKFSQGAGDAVDECFDERAFVEIRKRRKRTSGDAMGRPFRSGDGLSQEVKSSSRTCSSNAYSTECWFFVDDGGTEEVRGRLFWSASCLFCMGLRNSGNTSKRANHKGVCSGQVALVAQARQTAIEVSAK